LQEADLPESVRALMEAPVRLAILRCLKRGDHGKSLHARAVASLLHISEQLAEAELAILCGHGFLTVHMGASDVLYTYAASSTDPKIDELLERGESESGSGSGQLGR